MSDSPTPPAGDPHGWLLLAGLALLVPLPFVDDYLSMRALRRALAIDAAGAGAPLPDEALATLTEDRSSMLVGCLRFAVVWPLKKLFKTVLWFLTVKDVVDRMAYAAEVMAMVRLARVEGWLPQDAVQVRDAMEVSFGKHRWSPVMRFLLRYERPELAELPALGLAGLFQRLRKAAGAGAMEAVFLERARAERVALAARALEGAPGPA